MTPLRSFLIIVLLGLSAQANLTWGDPCEEWVQARVFSPNQRVFGLGPLGDLHHQGDPFGPLGHIRQNWVIEEIQVPASVTARGGPRGPLRFLRFAERGVTKSNWYADQNGDEWFVKKDLLSPGLQSSASVISALVYRHFGFKTAETFKIEDQGHTFSVARRLPQFEFQDYVFMIPESLRRRLRVIEYLVADHDRSSPGNGFWSGNDGQLFLTDFDATLGSDAWGHAKPGGQFISRMVGAFPRDRIPSTMAPEDVRGLLPELLALTDELILDFVMSAEYPSEAEIEAVVAFLRDRRDALIQFAVDPLSPSSRY